MTYDPYQPPPTRPLSVPPQYDPQQQPPSAMQPYSAQPYSPPPGPMPPQQQYPVSPMPMGYAQPPLMVQPVVPSSGYAVWALVLSLVGFFAGWCLLGVPNLGAVILGHVALSDTKNNAKSGRGMAVAGLAIGYVTLVPAIILFFWLVVGGAMSLPMSTAP